MTKLQLTANIIFFIPLLIINLLVYGIQGDIDLVRDIHKNLKKFSKRS